MSEGEKLDLERGAFEKIVVAWSWRGVCSGGDVWWRCVVVGCSDCCEVGCGCIQFEAMVPG